jgi:hypothetical protein
MGALASIDIEVVIILGLVAALAYTLSRLAAQRKRSGLNLAGEPTSRPGARVGTTLLFDRIDAADQLRAVMAAGFARSRVLEMAEYRVFHCVEREMQARGEGHRVFAQIALGEVIRSDDRHAHSAINSKRADILVIDRAGYPVIAIEYQGRGHYRRDAAARDAVKKEALRRAGVAYLEFYEYSSEDDIRRTVRETLDRGGQTVSPPPAGAGVLSHPFVRAGTLRAESPGIPRGGLK